MYREAADELGRTLAGAGHTLVYGGGHVGLMGVVADAALAVGGQVIGVMTDQLVAAEVAHGGLTALEITPTMHARKARMAELADGVIVLPGGFGTLDETFEIITWNQLGLVSIPVVFVDVDGFFAPVFDMIDRTVAAGFMSDRNAAIPRRVASVTDAVDAVLGPPAAFSAKWIG